MEQELFDVLSALEMRAEKERMQQGETEIMDPDAAKFVSLLAVSKNAKSIVEVGSGVGYSTLWLAYAALATGGKVITCEIDPAKADETRSADRIAAAGRSNAPRLPQRSAHKSWPKTKSDQAPAET